MKSINSSINSNENNNYKIMNIRNSYSLNSSFKSAYTTKKRKFKKNKIKIMKNLLKNYHNSSNSIESNNYYMNASNKKFNHYIHYSTSFSISNKSRNKFSNYSSDSSLNNSSECSDSSATSYISIQNYKRYKYFSKMITDENELDNITKKETGIITSDGGDNNINSEENIEKYYNNSLMNNMLQENYSQEIEHILNHQIYKYLLIDNI